MPYAEEARDYLNDLVEGKEIVLELGKGDSRDKYDRLLVYGFLPTGENIQKTLLKEGLLTVRYIYEDKKYLDDYIAAMEKAKKAKIGVWSILGYAGYDQPYNLDAVTH
jgi:endonuclease YncB( thermonuclease family)